MEIHGVLIQYVLGNVKLFYEAGIFLQIVRSNQMIV
jgi:hypothetical protein